MHRRTFAMAVILLVGSAAAQDGPPPTLVTTDRVTEDAIRETIGLLGTVRPAIDSLVACEVAGRVAARQVENGDSVAKGASLVRLDSTWLEQQLDQAISERDEVQALLELAVRQEKRANELYADQVLASGDVDQAVSNRQALEGRIRAVEARIARTRDDVARTNVRAPFSGVVTEVRTEIGEWITQGEAVVRLSKLDPVEILVEVPEKQFPRLSRGDRVPATIEALPGLRLDGKIHALVPLADPDARTFPVLVRAPNPDGRVAAGMLARVELTLGTSQGAILVPKDAIVRQANSEVVFVVVDGDVVRSVPVISGRDSGERVEVAGDLRAGEIVVVRGNERLAPGQKVLVDSAEARARDGG